MTMLTCQQVVERVADYLEGRLSLGQRVRFRLRLGFWRDCRADLRQMRRTVRALGRLPEDAFPPAVRERLLRRLRTLRR